MIINPDGLSNFHTHTVFCDGKDTPLEMAEKAVSLGFTSLGFSGHQYSEPEKNYAMSGEMEIEYRKAVLEAEEKYKGKIDIYLGVERDYFAQYEEGIYDYVIGSVHSVKKDGKHIFADDSKARLVEEIQTYYGGDYLAFARDFFDLERQVLKKTGGHILGHFDLLRKNNEGGVLFDEDNPIYRKLARDAIHDIVENFDVNRVSKPAPGRKLPPFIEEALNRGKPVVEINTGAMAKGYRTVPYPSREIINELVKMDVPLILSSDCHNREYLTYGFDYVKKI